MQPYNAIHWNGQKWDSEIVSERYGTIYKIWGSSRKNIYFVGSNGNITFFNGTNWQKMESGTDLPLTDIWDLSKNDIYAVGADMSSIANVVLHYNGESWQPYWESLNLSGTALKAISVVRNSVFIVGSAGYQGIIFNGRRLD